MKKHEQNQSLRLIFIMIINCEIFTHCLPLEKLLTTKVLNTLVTLSLINDALEEHISF